MGGAVLSKEEKRDREIHRHSLMRAVERFVINVYAACPRLESMTLILTSDMGIRFFRNFVHSEHADEALNLHREVGEILRLQKEKKKVSAYQLTKTLGATIEKFIRPETATQVHVTDALRNEMMEFLQHDQDDPNYITLVYELSEKCSKEAIFIMARDQFNRFMFSKYYKQWRAAESSYAIAQTAFDAETHKEKQKQQELKRMETGFTVTDRSGGSGGRSKKKRVKDSDLSVRAFVNVDMAEIGRILGSESWMAALLAAVEGLPIAFSLATARKDRKGFPLMYVNKYFEKVTGYTREEVIGKSCKVLQCSETEKDKVAIISDALKAGGKATEVLTNKKSNSDLFKNLISLKPVVDDSGHYCYVMCIHVDVTREIDLEYTAKKKMANDLMDLLPELIITDDSDEFSFSCVRT